MSPLSWNACDPLSSPFLPAGPPDKKTIVLNHLSSSKRLIDVRPASRLEVRPRPEMLSTGIAEVDAISGGIPRGCLSEICGPLSSGKTSLLLAAIAAATLRDETCVLIDASDSFDPESAATAGVGFGKLLWVRCGGLLSVVRRRSSAPSMNADDRGPKTDDVIKKNWNSSERKLEQVLKTTDLVLQSGGFGMVALDLAGIPEKFVRRIPLASWFRFQRAVEHTKTALLVVSEFACAQTCATVVLKLSAISPHRLARPYQPRTSSTSLGAGTNRSSGNQLSAIGHQPSEKPLHAQLLEGMRIEAELLRMRLERKPSASVRAVFSTKAIRAG